MNLINEKDRKTLAIILPCYNPTKSWDVNLVKRVNILEKSINASIKIVVTDDGSTERISKKVIESLQKQISIDFVFSNENRGKGAALREGISSIEADSYIYTDYDFPFSNESIVNVYKKLLEQYDVVCGFRDAPYYNKLPKRRKWVSKNMQFLTKYILRLNNYDTQAGLKGFNNDGKKVFLATKVNKFLFDTEFIYLSEKREKLNVISILVSLSENIEFSNMGIKTLLIELKNFFKIFFSRK